MLTQYARQGGVTQFLFSLISASHSCNGEHQIYDHMGVVRHNLEVNSFTKARSLARKALVIKHMLTFTSKLGDVDHVLLNPSLGGKSMYREMYYAKKCVLYGKRFSIFFHGWDWRFAETLDANNSLRKKYVDLINNSSNVFVLGNEFRNKLVSWGCDGDKIYLEKTMVNDDFVPVKIKMEFLSNKLRILFLSRVTRPKGIFEAVDAFKLHMSKSPESELTIAGSGEDIDALKDYVNENAIANIEFFGFANDAMKRKLMNSHDVFILPSYSEGMPISIFEAMAHGLTIITRPVGGIPGFFKNKDMGFLVDSLLPEDFANALNEVIDDKNLRERVSQFNHNYVIDNVTSTIVSRRILAKMEACCEK